MEERALLEDLLHEDVAGSFLEDVPMEQGALLDELVGNDLGDSALAPRSGTPVARAAKRCELQRRDFPAGSREASRLGANLFRAAKRGFERMDAERSQYTMLLSHVNSKRLRVGEQFGIRTSPCQRLALIKKSTSGHNHPKAWKADGVMRVAFMRLGTSCSKRHAQTQRTIDAVGLVALSQQYWQDQCVHAVLLSIEKVADERAYTPSGCPGIGTQRL